MLIYGIIFPRWRVAADVSLGSWKIFRRFFPSLFRPIIASAGRKCYTAPAIIPLLFLSPSLISFKSSFGHSPEEALAQEKTQAKADRRELAALREMLFLRENADSAGGAVSFSLPCEVKRRLVVYGGHETWRKAMKGYLTGDIRYMDKEQAIIDRSVIRNADMVWIQSNALSHRQYYTVIDEVRKTGVPVKYFLYASARKCAEQVAEEEG